MLVKECICGRVYHSKSTRRTECPVCHAKNNRANENDIIFVEWAYENDYELYLLTHGETYRLRKDYNNMIVGTGRKFSLRINPDSRLPEKLPLNERMTYYRSKINAIQYNGFDEWEAFRMMEGNIIRDMESA